MYLFKSIIILKSGVQDATNTGSNDVIQVRTSSGRGIEPHRPTEK